MDCTGSAAGLELRNRGLSAKQKLPKRVSFKDETWVINIPSREESSVDLRESVVFTRNALAGNSWSNRIDAITNRRLSLETFSTSSLHANGGQRSSQSTQTCRVIGSGHDSNRAPYKSILKSSTSARHRESHLSRTCLPASNAREVPAKHSIDNYNYFKHDSSHLLPTRDTINRLEKPVLARSLPERRTALYRGSVGTENNALYNKTTRFPGGDQFSPRRTSFDHDFNRNESSRTTNAVKQPQVSFDVVGVTYGRVDKMPYFHDISGIVNGVKENNSVTNSPNDRPRLAHSTVSTTNQFDSKREGRYLSAIPAIAAFNRKTRGSRKQFSSAWTHEYDSSPKRQLPIAWQPAKQYNFSTK